MCRFFPCAYEALGEFEPAAVAFWVIPGLVVRSHWKTGNRQGSHLLCASLTHVSSQLMSREVSCTLHGRLRLAKSPGSVGSNFYCTLAFFYGVGDLQIHVASLAHLVEAAMAHRGVFRCLAHNAKGLVIASALVTLVIVHFHHPHLTLMN